MLSSWIRLLAIVSCMSNNNLLSASPQTTERIVEIIPRSAWNAKTSLNEPKFDNFTASNVLIDHSLTVGCLEKESCSVLIRSFQDFHMNDLGRDDIHYNFMIAGDGTIYEGRGWNRAADIVEYSNDESIVISFIGDYRREQPNEKQLTAGQDLIKEGLSLHKIQRNYGLYGVRQFCDNDSPGQALFDVIKAWPHFSSTRKNSKPKGLPS